MLALICSLFIGLVVGLLGSGPAILSLPVFIYLKEEALAPAVLMSLVVGAVFSIVGSYSRTSNISIKSILFFLPVSILGSFYGVKYSSIIPEFWRIALLSCISFLAAGLIFYKLYKSNKNQSKELMSLKLNFFNILIFVFFSYILGFLSALLGVSGGFLIIPLFVGIFALSLPVAVATSLFLSIANSLLALIFYYQKNSIKDFLELDWVFLSQFLVLGIVGVILGLKFSSKVSHIALKKILGAFLFLLGLLNLYQAVLS